MVALIKRLFNLFKRKKIVSQSEIKLLEWTYAEYRLANQKMDDDGGFCSHSQRLAAAERRLATQYNKYWVAHFHYLQAKAEVKNLASY